MIITGVLTGAVCFCLFYGRVAPACLVALCVGLGLFIAAMGRHRHTGFLTIDVLAQTSRLQKVNPTLKLTTAIVLMVLCLVGKSVLASFALVGTMLWVTVWIGGLPLGQYLNLLSLPLSFLLLGALALLFEATPSPAGVLSIPFFGRWLSVGPDAQGLALLVLARSLGAVSCLYYLSLSTPLSVLITVLRKLRCPSVVVSLMYLIYRQIFLLLDVHHNMCSAAKSRLGFTGCRNSLRTTGSIYANLLALSYRKANLNFDAMESRCFDMDIRFLETASPIKPMAAILSAGGCVLMLALVLLIR